MSSHLECDRSRTTASSLLSLRDPKECQMKVIKWNIGRKGRAWRVEAMQRWELTPEKIEMVKGKLFYSDDQRIAMLGMLLENMGADAAVRLGDPEVWRQAVARLPK